jgi:hypothetical protein
MVHIICVWTDGNTNLSQTLQTDSIGQKINKYMKIPKEKHRESKNVVPAGGRLRGKEGRCWKVDSDGGTWI